MKLYPKMPSARSGYEKREGRGVEAEIGQLLYALVRVNKPKVCIETGTYVGDAAEQIARACHENGFGSLVTCDVDLKHIGPGRYRLRDLPAEVRFCTGEELIQSTREIDFIHIDSGLPDVRARELALIGEHNVSPLGIVAWHDAYEHRAMYEEFAAAHDWPHLIFPSLVGLAVFQRPE